MKIACIDNYDSFVFNLVRYLKTDPEQPEVRVFRNTAVDYNFLDACDGILLSPGPGIPSEAGAMMEVIDRYHSTKSLFGVCLGHQAIGEYFGAQLEQCAEPIHGKADEMHQIGQSEIYQDLKGPLSVGRYHSWRIRLNGNEPLRITGISSDDTIQSLQHRSLPVYGVQFHPESILTPAGRNIVSNWIKSLKK
jgi:anthranilate synthase component 2